MISVNICLLLMVICAVASANYDVFSKKVKSHLTKMAVNRTVHHCDSEEVPNLIKKAGYPIESHKVETEDGYILTLHRIPHGVKKHSRIHWHKKVVFLQHGFLSSSGTWVINTPDSAAAFLFADLGYDVWMGNFRGNGYSRHHKTLSPNCRKFWSFSWDEMAYFDLPAMIDYVLKTTNNDKLYYIGHSMGTTTFFAMMSEKPQYNSKINLFVGLAPVASVSNIETAFRHLAFIENGIWYLLDAVHMWEILPDDSYLVRIIQWVCNLFTINERFCSNMLFFTTGFDNHELNVTWFDTISHTLLSGTSLNNLVHFGQNYEAQRFQHFDYGEELNIKKYGEQIPPLYDLSKVTAPVVLLYGENDYLADPTDVKWLSKQLPNLIHVGAVADKDFNHLDFLWAIDEYKLVWEPLMPFIKAH